MGEKNYNYSILLKRAKDIWKTYGTKELLRRGLFYIKKGGWERNSTISGTIRLSIPQSTPFYHKPSDPLTRVLFISSGIDQGGFSEMYRIKNMAELLRLKGVFVETIHEIDIRERNLTKLTKFPIVVFFRINTSPVLIKFIEILKILNSIIVFSIDDLLLNPKVIPYLNVSKFWSTSERIMFSEIFRGYHKVLKESHYCIASSVYLANQIQKEGKKTFVIPSGLNAIQVSLADTTVRGVLKPQDNSIINLVYVSGSPTHDADFLTISFPLCRILSEYPQVCLNLIGPISVPEPLKKFILRIKRYPFTRDAKRLMQIIRTMDINLAPLERENPFCRAKNDMKYFEAGILEIPTIASHIEAFSTSINSGRNGLLAKNSLEWYQHIVSLVENPKRRLDMGKAARNHVLKYYTPDCQSEIAAKTFRDIIESYCYEFQKNKH